MAALIPRAPEDQASEEVVDQATSFSKAFKRSCRKCDRVRVCVVFKAVAKILETHFTKDTQPFQAEDLASVCNEFLSVELAATLKGSQ